MCETRASSGNVFEEDLNSESFVKVLMDFLKNFFSPILLYDGQLWAIVERRASPDVNTFLSVFKGHWKPSNEVGPVNPAKFLVGFELGTFWFLHKALNHEATLSKFENQSIKLKAKSSSQTLELHQLIFGNFINWRKTDYKKEFINKLKSVVIEARIYRQEQKSKRNCFCYVESKETSLEVQIK